MTTPSPSDSPAQSDSLENPEAFDNAEIEPSFGWNQYAEKVNGRFAMIGLLALLITELITRQDFFSWIGIP